MRAILVVLFMGLCHPPCFAQTQSHPRIAESGPLIKNDGAITEREGSNQNQYSLPVRIIETPPESEAERNRAEHTQKREQADLNVQTRMAIAAEDALTFAYWQTCIAGIATLVAIAGTIGLFKTINLTKRQASAAEDANHTQLRMFEAQTRPHLEFAGDPVVSVRSISGSSRSVFVRFTAKNHGQSHATAARGYIKITAPIIPLATPHASRSFAESFRNKTGETPRFVRMKGIQEWHLGETIPNDFDETFAGWLIKVCVTYRRDGGDKIYYTAAQVIVHQDDALAAYEAEGTVENIPCRYARESEVAV